MKCLRPSLQIPSDHQDEEYDDYEDDLFEDTPSEVANLSRIPVASNNRNASLRSSVLSVDSVPVSTDGAVSRRHTKESLTVYPSISNSKLARCLNQGGTDRAPDEIKLSFLALSDLPLWFKVSWFYPFILFNTSVTSPSLETHESISVYTRTCA